MATGIVLPFPSHEERARLARSVRNAPGGLVLELDNELYTFAPKQDEERLAELWRQFLESIAELEKLTHELAKLSHS